jgi:hypothetical protein
LTSEERRLTQTKFAKNLHDETTPRSAEMSEERRLTQTKFAKNLHHLQP